MTDVPDNSNHERDDHNELDEHSTRPIHLTQGEINALEKAIMYLKFAGSLLLNSVLEKARDASQFGEFAKDFHSRPNEYAETFMRDKLERSYAEELAPRERSTEQKNEILRACMFPYPVK